MNTGKASLENPQWIFIDKDGNPFNSKDATIRIVRSGRRNLLDQNIGSVTSLDYPVRNNGKLKFNDATNIIQTGAATFKDHWRVDNSFYVVDSVVEVRTRMQVHKLTFSPSENLSLADQKCKSRKQKHKLTPFFNTDYFNSEYQSFGTQKGHSKRYVQSWAMYNFSSLPADATIVKARLSLPAHTSTSIPNLYNHNQNLPDCNVSIRHTFSNPHHDITRNDFYISRIKKTWSSNFNNDQWFDFFYNLNYIDMSNTVHAGPTQLANKSYLCDQKAEDGSLDVTLMVQKMILENRDPLKGYPTGIKISKKAFISQDFTDWEKNTNVPSICFEKPKIEIYYYACSDNVTSASSEALGKSISPNVSTPSCDPNFPQFECVTSQHRLFCFSKFTDKKSINPYTEGILGNWRIDTTYAYYGNRKESDPIAEVDIRTAGTIANYRDFWNLSNNKEGYLSRNTINKDVWVWNSTITQYNRKGYEIENKDPLGRFNAGLYGYNQQLPIAVANNSRVREALFDGFEDYDYQSSQNCITCKPHRSFNYDRNILAHLDSTQHHTGQKSLRLEAGESISIVAPVTNTLIADGDFGLRMKMDSLKYRDTLVMGKGTGLRGKYIKYYKTKRDNFCGKTKKDVDCIANRLQTGPYNLIRDVPDINYNSGSVIMPGYGDDYIAVKWQGYLQPKSTGYYYFQTYSDDGVKLKLDGRLLINKWTFHSTQKDNSSGIRLVKGKTYFIELDYFNAAGAKEIKLFWKTPNNQDFNLIPTDQLYLPDRLADAISAVTITDDKWCTRLDSVNVRGNAVTDTFSLLQNKKMLVSTWVKEGGKDCKCSTYTQNNILVTYKGATGNVPLTASGNIIEGWQRYEGFFDIPSSATEIKLTLNNTSAKDTVYFDDIRIHPFNANMKSFVYHSSNLRLTSELDENNYATFYEYDDDGTLTRVKKETERGIKTITETRSAMQKVIKEP